MTEGQLKGLIPRTRELGRLRTGESATKTNAQGKEVTYPVKRTTWRITSPALHLLNEAAEVYGGTVSEWTDAPTPGQWQLSTDKESIEVLIPYNDTALSQSFELWRAGGCERRCNGEFMSDDSPCACPADIEERMAGAAQRTPTACKPTTRLNVILPDISEIGYFRLECHGYHAAVEIPGQLALARGLALRDEELFDYFMAFLRIEERVSKKGGETRRFTVPVIEIPRRGRDLMGVAHGEVPALSTAAQAEGVPVASGHTGALQAGAARSEVPATSAAPPPQQHSEPASRERHATGAEPEPDDPPGEPYLPPSATKAPDPFDAFVSEAWAAAFYTKCNEAGLPPEDIAHVVLTGTGGRTKLVGQIHKGETAAVKAALENAQRVA